MLERLSVSEKGEKQGTSSCKAPGNSFNSFVQGNLDYIWTAENRNRLCQLVARQQSQCNNYPRNYPKSPIKYRFVFWWATLLLLFLTLSLWSRCRWYWCTPLRDGVAGNPDVMCIGRDIVLGLWMQCNKMSSLENVQRPQTLLLQLWLGPSKLSK